MFSSQAAEISLNAPVRALDSVKADKSCSRFLVGSCSSSSNPNNDNHLHVVRYHSDANQLGVDAMLQHPTGAVSKVLTAPADKTKVLTIAEQSSEATLYSIPNSVLEKQSEIGMDEDDDDDNNNNDTGNPSIESMETAATLAPTDGSMLVDVKWRGAFEEEPSSYGDVFTLDTEGQLTQWDLSFGAADQNRSVKVNTEQSSWNLPPRMAWDPHQPDMTAVASGTQIQLVDWRADASVNGTSKSFTAHRYGVMDLDYNPNKPYVLATAGQDGLLKFWDLRMDRPLLVARGGHRHWTSRVQYNPFHDQLLLSTGSDSVVNLWRISSISSAPLLTLDEGGDKPNVRVSRYEHMDSVHAMTWGIADAWIYLTAGYDGKVVLNHVPSKEKYKILL